MPNAKQTPISTDNDANCCVKTKTIASNTMLEQYFISELFINDWNDGNGFIHTLELFLEVYLHLWKRPKHLEQPNDFFLLVEGLL